jgi:hypothetical protein
VFFAGSFDGGLGGTFKTHFLAGGIEIYDGHNFIDYLVISWHRAIECLNIAFNGRVSNCFLIGQDTFSLFNPRHFNNDAAGFKPDNV